MALTVGFQYPSGAVIGDGSTAAAGHLDLRGQPGTRLPHRWADGKAWSTLDLAGTGLTLVTGAAGDLWAGQAGRLGLCVRRAGEGPAGEGQPGEGLAGEGQSGEGQPGEGLAGEGLAGWAAQVGLGDAGALLLRPDHVVAWRSAGPPGGPDELEKVTGILLGR